MNEFMGTTICAVKKDGHTAIAGDGQVTMSQSIIFKNNAVKVRRIYNGNVIFGFAGSVADAFTLSERFEEMLNKYSGNLMRSAVELAELWRSDKVRKLEAMMITADKDSVTAVKSMLMEEHDEQFTAYLMNILSDLKAEIPAERYMEFALYDYPENIGELATEALVENADKVKDKVLKSFELAADDKKDRLSEILASVKEKSDDVFDKLVYEFVKNKKKIPLYANYLAKYGDERAIPFLKTAIEGKVNYQEFEELM